MEESVNIKVSGYTDEQRKQKAAYLETIGELDSSSLKILAKKIKAKGPEVYNKKIKKLESLL